MKTLHTFCHLGAILAIIGASTLGLAQDETVESDTFTYNVGEVNWLTGQGVALGGILTPSVYANGTFGVFEPGANPEDFQNGDHDPQNEAGIQGIDIHFGLNINDVLTGMVTTFLYQSEDHEWQGNLEEAYIHYAIADNLLLGGGQFLNSFGFQNTLHLHDWAFVNQDLPNARLLNEGELVTQGGEVVFLTPGNNGRLTIGFGGVRSHGHGHGHGEEEEDHDEEEHHLEADEANFNDNVFSTNYRFHLPFDPSIALNGSVAVGENGFGRDTYVYGIGLQKIWNGHDHGSGVPEFCTGALLFRTELIFRDVDAVDEEDGDALQFSDEGISTMLQYGICDRANVSFRHDWVSGVGMAELPDAHRFSPALDLFLGPDGRVRTRFQYDHIRNDEIGSEHVGWLQVQIQWGGESGSHVGHLH